MAEIKYSNSNSSTNQVNIPINLTNNQKRHAAEAVAKAQAEAEKARKKANSNLKAAQRLGYNVKNNTAKRLQNLEKKISNMSKTDPSYVKQYLIPEQRELRRQLGVRNKTYGEMGRSALSTYGRAPLSGVKEGLRIAKAGLTEIRDAPVNAPSRIGSLYLNEPAKRNYNKSFINMGRSTVKAVASAPRGVATGLKEVWRSGWNALDEVRYNTPGAPSRMNSLYRNTTKKAEQELNEQRKKNERNKNAIPKNLPTQQNLQINSSVRPAELVQPVSTATPSKSAWWPFGGGRKSHRKTHKRKTHKRYHS